MVDKYVPDPIVSVKDQNELLGYIVQELQKISTVLSATLSKQVEEYHQEPSKPRERMVVAADGFDWNPGAGKGLYVYLLGQWYPLAAVQTGEQPPEEPPEEPPPEEPPEEPGEPGPLPPEQGRAIATYHCMGLYWTPPSPPTDNKAVLEYRLTGTLTWKRAHDMWFDSRNNECRGSVFWLDPDTEYDFQFSLVLGSPIGAVRAKTRSEVFPEGTVTTLTGTRSNPLIINEGGTPTAYRVYEGGTIDVNNGAAQCVEVRAPYVIVRNMTLRGGQLHGIRVYSGAHDVVIEHNDISNWGDRHASLSTAAGYGVGNAYRGGVFLDHATDADRLTVQYNQIHDPRYGANFWQHGHPYGPIGICIMESSGNHVIRWNSVYSDPNLPEGHKYYMDAISGEFNFSDHGFPGPDSDVYGNYVFGCADDGIELEGSGRNVRCWGNYVDKVAIFIGTTVVNRGPLYVFRNICNRTRYYSSRTLDNDNRIYAFKNADMPAWGRGQRYFYHNTTLQLMQSPNIYGLGVGYGFSGLGTDRPMTHTTTRNNMIQIWRDWWTTFSPYGGTDNSFDYDMQNANHGGGSAAGPNNIKAVPIYAAGHGPAVAVTGKYQLDPTSPGFDDGVVIPNLNSESYLGAAPDIGAHEAGTPDLVFGHLGSGKGAGEPI